MSKSIKGKHGSGSFRREDDGRRQRIGPGQAEGGRAEGPRPAPGKRQASGAGRRDYSGQRRSAGGSSLRSGSAKDRTRGTRRELTRAEREALRRRRARKKAIYRRRRIMVFGGAGLVFILLLALVVAGVNKKKKAGETGTSDLAAQTAVTTESAALTESSETAGDDRVSDESTQPIATPSPLPTPTPEPVSILITAAGDCTLGKDENADYETSMVAKYEEVGYFDYFLENVRSIFENDDLTIVNLEGTLTYSEDRYDKTYAFKADPSYINILSGSSVEAANLANNHSQDYGYDSYTDTIKYTEEAGISTFGYDRYAIVDVNGVKVGLIGLMEIFTGMDTQYDLLDMLEAVKAENPDLIIVSMHWGHELLEEPSDEQKALGRMAIDNGADLVIGHHPHVIQGIEKYNGRYICYSVGNFCFGGNAYPTDPDCMIVQERFTFQNGELTDVGEITTIPCRVSSSYSINNYQPTPLEGDEKERVQNKIDERSALVG